MNKKEIKCPLCSSNDFVSLKSTYRNVYSELLSKFLEIEENYLLNIQYQSIKCRNCSLLFWQEPLSRDIRKKLYTEIIPKHPKGEDSTGKYFSLIGLQKKIYGLSQSSKKRERIIDGYLSSMNFKNNTEKQIVCKALNDDNRNKLFNKKIEEIFLRGPLPFSRHLGFRETPLNQKIINLMNTIKLNAKDSKYIEYGCPDWGPINVLEKTEFNCMSIIPDQHIFWNCVDKTNQKNSVREFLYEKDGLENKKFKDSVLGLFLILDHIEDPLGFITFCLDKGVMAIVVLLERIDQDKGLPIQHLSAWNHQSLKFLAKSLSLKIEFPEIVSKHYIAAVLKKNY